MQTKTTILSAWIYGNAHTTFCSSLLPTAMVVALNSSNSARQPFQQRWKLFQQQLQWWQPFQQRGGSSTTNLPTRDDSDSIPPLTPPMPPLKDLARFASPLKGFGDHNIDCNDALPSLPDDFNDFGAPFSSSYTYNE